MYSIHFKKTSIEDEFTKKPEKSIIGMKIKGTTVNATSILVKMHPVTSPSPVAVNVRLTETSTKG